MNEVDTLLCECYYYNTIASHLYDISKKNDPNFEHHIDIFIMSTLKYLRKWNMKSGYLCPINDNINLSVFFIYSELSC